MAEKRWWTTWAMNTPDALPPEGWAGEGRVWRCRDRSELGRGVVVEMEEEEEE